MRTRGTCLNFFTTFRKMSSKVVLVSYMERNKKFTIPASKEQSDVEFLKKEFFTAFGIRRTQDHTVTLQSFDDEFGEFVDTKDDALFVNKTKLKAILVRQSETVSSVLVRRLLNYTDLFN